MAAGVNAPDGAEGSVDMTVRIEDKVRAFGVLLSGEPPETQREFAQAYREWADSVDVSEDVVFLAGRLAAALGG